MREGYEIGTGLKTAELPGWLNAAMRRLGTSIEPETNRLRIDYRRARNRAITMTTLTYKDVADKKSRFLAMHRVPDLNPDPKKRKDAADKWSLIDGYIDDVADLRALNEGAITVEDLLVKQVLRETVEETGIVASEAQVLLGASYFLKNFGERRSYYVQTARVDLGTLATAPLVTLNKEHDDSVFLLQAALDDPRTFQQYDMLGDTPFCVRLGYAA